MWSGPRCRQCCGWGLHRGPLFFFLSQKLRLKKSGYLAPFSHSRTNLNQSIRIGHTGSTMSGRDANRCPIANNLSENMVQTYLSNPSLPIASNNSNPLGMSCVNAYSCRKNLSSDVGIVSVH